MLKWDIHMQHFWTHGINFLYNSEWQIYFICISLKVNAEDVSKHKIVGKHLKCTRINWL